MQLYFRRGDGVHIVTIEPAAGERHRIDGRPAWRIRVGEREQLVELRREEDGRLEILVDGRAVRAHVARDGLDRWVQLEGGQAHVLQKADSPRIAKHSTAEGLDELIADTPAQVVSIAVAVGDDVAHGDTLIVLEAMKMEFRLTAPHDGHVTSIHCKPGEVVGRGRVLMEVERSD